MGFSLALRVDIFHPVQATSPVNERNGSMRIVVNVFQLPFVIRETTGRIMKYPNSSIVDIINTEKIRDTDLLRLLSSHTNPFYVRLICIHFLYRSTIIYYCVVLVQFLT